ncbi:CoA transferase [Rhodococcus sp. T2V]|uniref:CaiB/BaiF CoA transferase family protein n=1 Tax=Rhodococcus sp. T2V TaxID=3034164 RepID=UPI0023E11770|nr:CoA transferase [Rhodococcus sp. T2V]MDF3309685.1 CoA transferase [Rhodococcus sp. T2V]
MLDLASDISGSYAGRLLADLGADVVKVEDIARGGDETRGQGGSGAEATFTYLNQNKRSIGLDLSTQSGRQLWRRLIVRADVIVDSGDPGVLEQAGLDFAEVAAANLNTILVSITPFGPDGPYHGRPATPLTIAALGGFLKSLGDRDREPLSAGFPLVEYLSGVVASIGVVAAWRSVRSGHGGQRVDVAQQEVALRMPYYPSVAARVGHPTERRTPFPMYVQAINGYAAVNALSATHFRDACLYMGLDDVADDRRLAADSALRGEVAPRLQKRMDEWALDKTREEIFHVGQAMRIPTGIPYTLREVSTEDAYRQRGFFRPLQVGQRIVQQPVGPISGSSAARDVWTAAPGLGDHTDDVVGEWLVP